MWSEASQESIFILCSVTIEWLLFESTVFRKKWGVEVKLNLKKSARKSKMHWKHWRKWQKIYLKLAKRLTPLAAASSFVANQIWHVHTHITMLFFFFLHTSSFARVQTRTQYFVKIGLDLAKGCKQTTTNEDWT